MLAHMWAGEGNWEQKYPQQTADDLEDAINSFSSARLIALETAENIPSLHVGQHNDIDHQSYCVKISSMEIKSFLFFSHFLTYPFLLKGDMVLTESETL